VHSSSSSSSSSPHHLLQPLNKYLHIMPGSGQGGGEPPIVKTAAPTRCQAPGSKAQASSPPLRPAAPRARKGSSTQQCQGQDVTTGRSHVYEEQRPLQGMLSTQVCWEARWVLVISLHLRM
jgi:hypothetical protein